MKKKIASFMNSKYILIALSFLCLLFIGSSFFTDKLTYPIKKAVSAVVIPMQKGINNIGLWTYEKKTMFDDIDSLKQENEELKTEINDLEEKNIQLKQDGYELERLRELYKLDQKYSDYQKVGARIIGSTSNNWYSSFTIDKGSKDGIEKNMNVIAGNGLVGYISEVGDNYSIVKTIIEDNVFVAGMLIDTGDTCWIKGNIELMDTGMIKMEGFKDSVTVRNGDKIVTSNISDKYLSGIVVGYAKDVKVDSNNLTQSGYLVPAVDFGHLQEVLIITQQKNNGANK